MGVALSYDSTGDASDDLYGMITGIVSKRMEFVEKAATLLTRLEAADKEEAP